MQWLYLLFALQTLGCTILAAIALYKWQTLFIIITNKRVRSIVKIVYLTILFYSAFMPANLGWTNMAGYYKKPIYVFGAYVYVSLIAIITHIVFVQVKNSLYKLLYFYKQIVGFCIISIVPFLLDIVGQQLIGSKGKVFINNISYSFFIGCMAGLLHLFLTNYSKTKELERVAIENLRVEAELNALQAKINPHFLYNALSGLAGLALEDGKRASKMATALSIWFRYSLNKQQQLTCTVEEEMEMVSNYIEIEKIRFEEAVHFSISIANEAKQQLIPKFLIQPLVENALKHAFRNMQTKGAVSVSVSGMHPLVIEVADNGIPFPPNYQHGYGLQSIYNKLQLLFPSKHSINISNYPKCITITLYNSSYA